MKPLSLNLRNAVSPRIVRTLGYFLLVFLYSLSLSIVIAQDNKKAEKVQEALEIKEPLEIKIPLDLYNLLHLKELEAQNLELQIRLALKVPNDFLRQGDKFIKEPKESKKDEKTPSNPPPKP